MVRCRQPCANDVTGRPRRLRAGRGQSARAERGRRRRRRLDPGVVPSPTSRGAAAAAQPRAWLTARPPWLADAATRPLPAMVDDRRAECEHVLRKITASLDAGAECQRDRRPSITIASYVGRGSGRARSPNSERPTFLSINILAIVVQRARQGIELLGINQEGRPRDPRRNFRPCCDRADSTCSCNTCCIRGDRRSGASRCPKNLTPATRSRNTRCVERARHRSSLRRRTARDCGRPIAAQT